MRSHTHSNILTFHETDTMKPGERARARDHIIERWMILSTKYACSASTEQCTPEMPMEMKYSKHKQ